MNKMTGGQAVVQTLLAHDVDTLFGLPGIQNDWLYNALYDAGDALRVIHPRHEQGAGYMALGYALASGRPGVFNVVPGPGLLNATAALATAYAVNAPVFCLTGQIPLGKIGRGSGALHEIPDQLGVMARLTKWAARAHSPAEAAWLVAEGFQQMRSGRPRPVALEVPMDVLAATTVVAPAAPRNPFTPPVDDEQVARAARRLAAAERVLIFAGGGAQNVGKEVSALAEALQAPVMAYRTGHGVVDARSYLSLHLHAAHPLWAGADVVLAVGSNLRIPLTWGVDERLTIIRVDVDPSTHTGLRPTDIAVTARAEDVLPQLVAAVRATGRERPSRRDELLAARAAWAAQTAYLEPQLSYLRVIREALGEHGVFVDELTQVGYASRLAYPVYKPRTYISTGYMGTLGYGFPTALGVKVARPDVPVLAIAGDGGFLFSAQELATAVQHAIAVVVVVFNNNQYGNVQQMQRNYYDGRVIATDLHNPDFMRLAESFGAQALRAETPDALHRALQQAFAHTTGPTVVEVPHGDVPSTDRFRRLPRVR